jgi:ketosteroid isomerase-like protein
MADHPNAETFRAAVEAFNAGDPSHMVEAMSDDIVWHEIGRADAIRGKQNLIDQMSSEMGSWEIQATLHDVVSNDEHLIALVDAVATRDGKTLAYRTAEIHHIDADGKITERWAFSDDTAAIVDFFA